MKRLFSLCLAGLITASAIPTVYATRDYQQGTQVEYIASSDANREYTITVPALLNPGQEGTVTLKGKWASNEVIKVTADTTVELTNSINANDKHVLDITFLGIEKAGDNTAEKTYTEKVSVENMPSNALFGIWSGKFNYNVDTETIIPSEAYAIYDGETQSLYFVRSAEAPIEGETFIASNGQELNATDVYSDFENNASYLYDWQNEENIVLPEWHEHNKDIVYIEAIDKIAPVNMTGWFRDFYNCTAAQLSNFDTSNVTSMHVTFQAFGYSAEISQPISLEVCQLYRDWDNEGQIFFESYMETREFGAVIRGLQNWNTAKVENMNCMFANIGSATNWDVNCQVYVDDISGWDVANCMDFGGMFASSDIFPYSNDLRSWAINENANRQSIHYSGPNLWFCFDM